MLTCVLAPVPLMLTMVSITKLSALYKMMLPVVPLATVSPKLITRSAASPRLLPSSAGANVGVPTVESSCHCAAFTPATLTLPATSVWRTLIAFAA